MVRGFRCFRVSGLMDAAVDVAAGLLRKGVSYVDRIWFDFDNHALKQVIFHRPLANGLPVTLCSTDSVCIHSVLKAPATSPH